MAQAAAPPLEVGRRMPLVLLPEPITLGHAEGGGRRGLALRPGPGGLWLADAGILDAPPQSDWWGPRLSTPGTRTMRRLTFFSLSGGTGRTTLAVEVAGFLAGRMGSPVGAGGRPPRVALLDLDLLNARAGIRLGVPLPSGGTCSTPIRPMPRWPGIGCSTERDRGVSRTDAAGEPAAGRSNRRLRAGRRAAGRTGAAWVDVVVLDIPSGLARLPPSPGERRRHLRRPHPDSRRRPRRLPQHRRAARTRPGQPPALRRQPQPRRKAPGRGDARSRRPRGGGDPDDPALERAEGSTAWSA